MIALPRRQLKQQTRPETLARDVLATQTLTQYAAPDPNRYMCDRVSQSWTFELKEPPQVVEQDPENLIQVLADQFEAARSAHSMFREFRADWSPGQVSDEIRVIAHTLHYYDGEAFEGLPLGRAGSFGALVRTESLVLDETILQAAYGDERPPYFTPGDTADWTSYPKPYRDHLQQLRGVAGYNFYRDDGVHQPGYYVVGTRQQYGFQDGAQGIARGLLHATRDPLGEDGSGGSVRDTAIEYDAFDLLPVKVTTPAGLEIQAQYDYRVFQPREISDPNGNRSLFSFTPLGLLQETWVQGKGENEGDRERASSRMEYDFMAFVREREPISVRTIRREHHGTETDVDLPEREATIETREYSDGFGRLLQTRVQAEDLRFGDCNAVLPLDQGDDAGTRQPISGVRNDNRDAPNVVVSGWQIYNNKGWVTEKYEPFCDQGWEYDPSSSAQQGHRVTMHYDPRGQVIRTVSPDGSERRIIYGVPGSIAEPDVTRHDETGAIVFEPTPWEAFTYDANDLAPLSTKTLPDGSSVSLADRVPAHHHFTPGSILIDGLGRTVESVERNGQDPTADWHVTSSTYDLRGNLLTVTDPLGREAFRYVYDLTNRPLHTASTDAGMRRMIFDAAGNEIERRDSKGALSLQAYDILNRPLRRWARDRSDGKITLRERLEYGDGGTSEQPAEERLANREHNRLGQLGAYYDEAGLLILERYDFKGNVLETLRHVIRDEHLLSVFPQEPPDQWNIQPFQVDWQPDGVDFAAHVTDLLDPQEYRTSTRYDALNRIKSLQYPEDVTGERHVLRPEYNRAGALERVTLEAGEVYVEHIAYNARGQRILIAYGNGIMTRYAYHADTFRLARLRSERYSKPGSRSLSAGGRHSARFRLCVRSRGEYPRDPRPGTGLRASRSAGSTGSAFWVRRDLPPHLGRWTRTRQGSRCFPLG